MNKKAATSVDDELVDYCLDGNVEGLGQYLSAGNFGKINHGDEKTGDSPLHLAAVSPLNSFQMSRLLLDFGANPCSLNNSLESPVHCAAKFGHVDTLRLLIDGGGLSGILSTRREITGAKKSLKNTLSLGGSPSAAKSINKNLLAVACEAESAECVEYVIGEIMAARRRTMKSCAGGDSASASDTGSIDFRRFLEMPDPREVVFAELGSDLAASNVAYTKRHLERSLYARILNKTPDSFKFLLDSCLYECGKNTFVDFFLFHNEIGGSELNLHRILIDSGRFDLLMHPVCELFLHLKSHRARKIYWLIIASCLLDTMTVITYVLLCYGEVGDYFECNPCLEFQEKYPEEWEEYLQGSLYCYGHYLRYPVMAFAVGSLVVHLAKLYQERYAAWSGQFWRHQTGLVWSVLYLIVAVLDGFVATRVNANKILGSILVLLTCHNMVHAIARDPDIAIFVEMVSRLQKTLFKFLLSYIWLFIGWIVAFHITLGDYHTQTLASECLEKTDNSFHDLGSATGKVITMFIGEYGFETVFSLATNLSNNTFFTACIIVMYVWFLVHMSVILMNLLIGLSINNIQDLRKNADALRLNKEVMLQRYLESLMRLPILPRRLRTSRIADDAVFRGKRVYRLCRRGGGGDFEQKFALAPHDDDGSCRGNCGGDTQKQQKSSSSRTIREAIQLHL